MEIDLETRRDEIERAARAHRAATQRWLALAQIAVPAVLRAASEGNVTCAAAAREMAGLLSPRGGAR